MSYYLLSEGMIDEYVLHPFCLNLFALFIKSTLGIRMLHSQDKSSSSKWVWNLFTTYALAANLSCIALIRIHI